MDRQPMTRAQAHDLRVIADELQRMTFPLIGDPEEDGEVEAIRRRVIAGLRAEADRQ